MAWAHPRSRGENRRSYAVRSPYVGSSPLTRGKLCALPAGGGRGGLIPAHAGKTPRPAARPCRVRAHPRSRGENDQVQLIRERGCGSSPLTRGKRYAYTMHGYLPGLIPAHAGKTTDINRRSINKRAHPRSRRENTAAGLPAAGAGGLIPAHAGKTAMSCSMLVSIGAHPRSRGENDGAGSE